MQSVDDMTTVLYSRGKLIWKALQMSEGASFRSQANEHTML